MRRRWYSFVIVGLLIALLSACSDKSQGKDTVSQHVVTVKESTPEIPLYYRGVIAPIKTYSVTSPFDGRVAALHFHYGETVEKGDQIATISSIQLAEDFQKAVTDFLSKKSTYYNSDEDFVGVKMLYKAGVTAKSDYLSSESSYQNDVLSYLQSKYQLEKLLHKVHIDPTQIEQLSLADTDQLMPLLTKSFDHVPVFASGNGVALFPIPGDSDSDDEGASDELHVGSKLNEGQLMLSIGDLSGLSVKVTAAEDSINRIHSGMPVTVSSDAFPGTVLKGIVSSVSSQADPNSSSGNSLSQFPIEVTVPNVDPAALKSIKVGMTCKVTMTIKGKQSLMLPIKAVTFSDSGSTVRRQTARGGVEKVTVTTGLTTPEDIVILSGLKDGDKVLVDD